MKARCEDPDSDQCRERVEEAGALRRPGPAPVALEGGAGGVDGAVDIGLSRELDLGQRDAGRGLVELRHEAAR